MDADYIDRREALALIGSGILAAFGIRYSLNKKALDVALEERVELPLPTQSLPETYDRVPMPCTTDPSFSHDDDTMLLARMLWGECGVHANMIEKIAIAYSAINRKNRKNTSLRTELLRPHAYSCFLDRKKMLDPTKGGAEAWQESYRIADQILQGVFSDNTGGATHYVHYNTQTGLLTDGHKMPAWASKMESREALNTGPHEQLLMFQEK